MPVEITKYLCQFKCGTKAKSTLRQIVQHETTCFKNPARKACTTCKHEVYYMESDVIEDPYPMEANRHMIRGCKRLPDDVFDRELKRCDYHNKPVFHVPPVHSCFFWESRIELQNAQVSDTTESE